MSSKRTFWVLVAVLAILTIGLFGATYAANKLIIAKAQTIKDQRLQTKTLDAQSTALTRAKRDITKYQKLADIAKSIVPQDKDQAQTVREIVNIAGGQGISIGSVTFPSSSLGSTQVGANVDKSQLQPVPGIPGVYYLQLTVQSSGGSSVPYGKFIAFLNALEHNRRTALVSAITLTPDSKNTNNVGFALTLDEYIKP